MAVGNQTTYSVTGLNTELADNTVATHTVMAANLEFFERIKTFGVAGLESIGFTNADAQSYFATANYLSTIAQAWFGEVAITPPFNFDDATAIAR